MKAGLLILGIAATLAACSGKEQVASATSPTSGTPAPPIERTTQALPPGHPPITSASTPEAGATPSQSAQTISGRVMETMNAGGYTYVRLQTGRGDIWAAMPQTTVAMNSNITLGVQMAMENFESGTLHRKFERILFTTPVSGAAQSQSTPMMGHEEMSGGGTAAQHMNPKTSVAVASVERAPGGKTIAEVWAGRSELQGHEVLVRGQVVKFLPGIMGKNWLHLRDGSGSREKQTDDITVTSHGVAKVGDVVTVSGVLGIDKDFGSGYKYPAIVEDATIK